MTPVEQIVKILSSAGYLELAQPLVVANLRFEFASALIAKERSLDLVVLADIVTDRDESRLAQKIQALARALDLTESRRSLTVVTVNGDLSADTMEALVKVCRLLAVGVLPSEGEVQYLRDWLAVLLPLPDLDQLTGLADWKSELNAQLGKDPRTKVIDALTTASNQGPGSVETVFASHLKAELRKVLQERSND